MVEAGFGTWAEVQKIPDLERRALYFRAVIKQGAVVDWTTGRVEWPRRPS